MDSEILKAWKNKKQELLDCIDATANQNRVDDRILNTMKSMLLTSKVKCSDTKINECVKEVRPHAQEVELDLF